MIKVISSRINPRAVVILSRVLAIVLHAMSVTPAVGPSVLLLVIGSASSNFHAS